VLTWFFPPAIKRCGSPLFSERPTPPVSLPVLAPFTYTTYDSTRCTRTACPPPLFFRQEGFCYEGRTTFRLRLGSFSLSPRPALLQSSRSRLFFEVTIFLFFLSLANLKLLCPPLFMQAFTCAPPKPHLAAAFFVRVLIRQLPLTYFFCVRRIFPLSDGPLLSFLNPLACLPSVFLFSRFNTNFIS